MIRYGLTFFATLSLSLAHFAAANDVRAETQATIQGIVFEDQDQDGVLDSEERGLPNVQISDGDQIVLTDTEGRFAIQTTTTLPNTVFVINPNGFRPASRFYHPVVASETNVNFALMKDPASLEGPFSFYHTADFQFDGPRKHTKQIAGDLADMERWAETRDIRFYAICGDITTHGAVDDLALFNEQFDQLARPVYRIFGGHDALVEMARPKMGNWVDAFGPYTYAWNYGGVHFIALVSEGYLSEAERARQSRFWQQDMAALPPKTPIVLLAHTPDQISAEIGDAIREHNVIAYLFGHWHTHHTYDVDGVPFFTSSPMRPSDWGGFTKRTRAIHIDNGKLTSASRVLEHEKRLHVLQPHEVAATGSLTIRAHVYDTTHIPERVVATIETVDGALHGAVTLAQENDFTWAGTLADSVPPGDYRIRVRAGEGWDNGRGDTFRIVESLPPIETRDNWLDEFGNGARNRDFATASVPTLQLQWVATLPGAQPHRTGPVIVNGDVYVGVTDAQAGATQAGVVCLDGKNGTVRWDQPLPQSINAALASDGKRIFALSGQGTLYALDPAQGEIQWQADAYEGTAFHVEKRYFWRTFLAPVTAANGRVFVAGSYVLAAFDAANGTKLWTNYDDLCRNAYPMSGLAPAGDLVYFENEDHVVALEQDSGAVRWGRPLAELAGGVSRERGTATPLATLDAVYFHHRSRLRKLNPETGEEAWGAPSGSSLNYMGTPAKAPGAIVLASGGSIICVNDDTGERRWAFNTRTASNTDLGPNQDLRNGAAPLIMGDFVVAGGDDGYLYLLSLTDGKRWEYNTGAPIKASPAVSGNLIVVTNFAGNVFGFTIGDPVQ